MPDQSSKNTLVNEIISLCIPYDLTGNPVENGCFGFPWKYAMRGRAARPGRVTVRRMCETRSWRLSPFETAVNRRTARAL